MRTLTLVLALALTSCSALAPYTRILEACAPSPYELVAVVTRILLGGGNWQEQLTELGLSQGSDLVTCAVAALAEEWSETSPGPVERSPGLRGIYGDYRNDRNDQYELGLVRARIWLSPGDSRDPR